MRRLDGNSELKAKARLLVAVLILTAARLHAQEQAADGGRVVLVSLADRKLALIENGKVTKTYAVAVGKKTTPSPTGTFKIVTRVTNPTYYKPGQVIAPGTENPVGTRWIGLNQKGYGIHGTNAPKSIGKAASHGCIRMSKKDLEELFELVRPGDVVEIRGEQLLVAVGVPPLHFVQGRDDKKEPVVVASATAAVEEGTAVAAR